MQICTSCLNNHVALIHMTFNQMTFTRMTVQTLTSEAVKEQFKRAAHSATDGSRCSFARSPVCHIASENASIFIWSILPVLETSTTADRPPDSRKQKQGQLNHYFMISRTLWARSLIHLSLPHYGNVADAEWHIISLAVSQPEMQRLSFG